MDEVLIRCGRGAPTVMLRLPEPLKNRLSELAEQNGRSRNAEIVFRLQHSLVVDPIAEPEKGVNLKIK